MYALRMSQSLPVSMSEVDMTYKINLLPDVECNSFDAESLDEIPGIFSTPPSTEIRVHR